MDTQEAVREIWDVIIVGTGVGGATLGYTLSRKGLRVLFCEKGATGIDANRDLRGDYAENFLPTPNSSYSEHRNVLANAGRSWDRIEDCSHAIPHYFVPFIGWGAGGSSALYGMALERFFPTDFLPRANFQGSQAGNLPEAWPVSYGEFSAYYEAAEQLYRVRGTLDPLRSEVESQKLLSPPQLTPASEKLFRHIQSKGLHPYQLPMGCEYLPGCECCQGYLCPRGCKNDSWQICLKPAIQDHGAALLDNCEVFGLDANKTRVTAVNCRRGGEFFKLRSQTVVLASGALVTPSILLRSTSSDWPYGLANQSGLVGKNLMRHFIDLFLIETDGQADQNRFKEIAFNDYYFFEGQKLGTVQSFGRLPPVPVMVRSVCDEMKLPGMGRLLKMAMPFANRHLTQLVENHTALASIVEDIPYPENRVTVTSDGDVRISYRIGRQDMLRVKRMRRLVQHTLAPLQTKLVKQAHNNHRIAHACGTCRFGANPQTSVLDPNNRAHGVDNLYVVDASFFPSSGGTNPALTIAANALRVGEHLLDRHA